MKNQYREALDRARREGKLVLVNFTGYACTNCHWMKANMFPRPDIAAQLKDFVLVDLYTDGTDSVSEQNQNQRAEKLGDQLRHHAFHRQREFYHDCPEKTAPITRAGWTRGTPPPKGHLDAPNDSLESREVLSLALEVAMQGPAPRRS